MVLALAIRTGWSEAEILRMSPQAAAGYLELLTDSGKTTFVAKGIERE